jgi:hypothetical protein
VRPCLLVDTYAPTLARRIGGGSVTDHDFDGEWYGWRLRGRLLVSADGQRMTPERLRGLMWRDKMELRRAGFASRRKAEEAARVANRRQMVKVVIVDLADYRLRGVAAS